MDKNSSQEKQPIYCAIYTRKSTSEGLDQDFTSLDAQRESAENYINSQKNEGWIALEDQYNDGGYTGANTDRPALGRLIEDIKVNKINCVVVYKVDRLSRSLIDFVQMLELFEQNKVTFVSVTQQFSTNTSMGRLTLNILLSFAQFEREIISERTKDKMAAARKRGKWLGGKPPLGYNIDKEGRKLVINPQEAELVKTIYDLYLKGYSLRFLAKELTNRGYKTKSHTSQEGKMSGGNIFQSTTLNGIIRNTLYIGKVKHAEILYDGEQEAIIDEKTFYNAMELLKKNRNYQELIKGQTVTNPLTKILFCKKCNTSMFGTHTPKKQKIKYRYYVCSHAQKYGYETCTTRSINAHEIEKTVAECLFERPEGAGFKETWQNLTAQEQKSILVNHIKRVDYDAEAKKLFIAFTDGTSKEYDIDLKGVRHLDLFDPKEDVVKEPKLRQRLILAYHAQQLLDSGQATSIKQIAQWLNMSAIKLHLIMELLFISPKIQEEILLGSNETLNAIPEYKPNIISKESDWGKQYDIWLTLVKNPI